MTLNVAADLTSNSGTKTSVTSRYYRQVRRSLASQAASLSAGLPSAAGAGHRQVEEALGAGVRVLADVWRGG